jgi:DNA-binding transcriptional LysR family regulator
MCGVEIGRLCVGIGPAMSESFVATAIARLAEAHPKAQIVARVDHWSQLAEWLRRGEVDLFIADISHTEEGHEFQVIPMPSEEFVWFCRPEHPLASAKRVTRKELLAFPIVTPKMPIWARQWLAEAADPRPAQDEDRTFATVECESYSMLKRMVMASDCISAALQSTIRSEVAEGSLVALPIKTSGLKTKAGIVHLRGRTLSPLAEALLEKVVQAAKRVAAKRA